MNFYKKIFISPKLRIRILKLFNWISDKTMIKMQYRIKIGKALNLKNPSTFTEKLQWYKLFYRNEIMHMCVDKYEVRKYVKEKGLESILNKLYGVYDSIEKINLELLPEKFVIKSTNGGGGVNILICKDKSKFNLDNYKKLLKEWIVVQKKSLGREWAYEGLTPKIIIENYLENKENPNAGIKDYKFFCYNGKVKYIVVDIDRYTKHKRNFYDENWNYLDIESDCESFKDILEKPKKYDEMKKIAEKLSENFPFVRVDLYYVDNKIYFGELTFYPWSGYVKFYPDSFNVELGKNFLTK